MNVNDKKSFCLRRGNCNGITYRGKIRIFTPIECERLQTIPDDYTKYMIDDKNKIIETKRNKRYESIGNGWTVDVISHIFKELFYQNILNKKTEY